MPQSSYKSGSWWVRCKNCGEEKRVEDFYINQTNQKPRSDCKVCYNSKHKKPTKEKRQEITKRHYIKYKKEINLKCQKWRQNNLEYDAFRSSLRRSLKTQRIPKWSDLEQVKNFYLNCPEGYHVDHIIPLKGRLVSGLHVLNNLQYLTAKENLSKRNKYAV